MSADEVGECVRYVITQADVDEATSIAHAALIAASGRRPLVLSIAAVVMFELARVIASSNVPQSDHLLRDLFDRFRATHTDSELRALLAELAGGAPAPASTSPGGVA